MSLKQKQKKVPFADEFPELADMLTFAGLEEDDSDNEAESHNDNVFPFAVGKKFLSEMDDESLIRYIESIESGTELFTLINLNCSGYEGLERFNNMVKTGNNGIQPELIPVIMLSSYLELCETELRDRNMLVEYRKNHPFYNFATDEIIVYESYYERILDLIAQFTAGYLDDVAVRDVFGNLHQTYSFYVDEYQKTHQIQQDDDMDTSQIQSKKNN